MLYNWAFWSMGVGMVVYYFRDRLKRMLLSGVITGLKMSVLYYNHLTKKGDSINPNGVVYIEDKKIIIHEYDIVYNNKSHKMCFISEKYDSEVVNTKLVLFNDNKEDILAQRHKFVYCSIINKDRECLKDITDEMRAFMFYFKKGYYVCNVEYVLKYLQSKYNGLKVKDCNLLFVLNDDEFTEKVIELDNTGEGILFHTII